MARPRKQQEALEVPSQEPILSESTTVEAPSIASDPYGKDAQFESAPLVTENLLSNSTVPEQSIVTEPEISQTSETEEPIFTEDELKAMESGWTPKVAYKGNPDNWRDAKSWNERNRTFNVVEEQRRKIEELEKSQREILQILRDERDSKAKSQLSSLERDKEEAIKMSDVARVKAIDEQIYAIRSGIRPEVKQEAVAQQPPRQEPPEVASFKQRNPWFMGTDDLSRRKTLFAQSLEQDLINRKVNMSVGDAMAYIEHEVRQMFDSKTNISPTETKRGVMSTPRNTLPSYESLPREAKVLVETFARKAEIRARSSGKQFNLGDFRSKYIKELIASKSLDNAGRLITK